MAESVCSTCRKPATGIRERSTVGGGRADKEPACSNPACTPEGWNYYPKIVQRVCPTCNGAGYLYNEETYTREPCNCKIAEYMFKHLGAEIAKAETIFSSPLYELPETRGEPPKLDRTTENLHLKCNWSDLLPHLKLCLWTKGIFFNFRVVTDEKIKTVFVGAESYSQRSKSKRDDMVTYNTLSDLVGTEYPFVIIRLGHLGHKNVAAAGAVKEALMIRDVAQKPTWIIEEPGAPFDPSNFAYSDDLAEYMDRNFKTVTLGANRAPEPQEEEVVGGVEDVSVTAPVPRQPRPAAKAPEPELEPTVIDDNAAIGSSSSGGYRRPKWKPKKRRGDGEEGPL